MESNSQIVRNQSNNWKEQRVSNQNLHKAYRLFDRIESGQHFKVHFSSKNVKKPAASSVAPIARKRLVSGAEAHNSACEAIEEVEIIKVRGKEDKVGTDEFKEVPVVVDSSKVMILPGSLDESASQFSDEMIK